MLPLVYALENKTEFDDFINDTGVETTNNASESCQRRVAWARNYMLFTATADGYRAYADLLTIIGSCEMNSINSYTYLLWVLDNAKLRLEIYPATLKTATLKELCKHPKIKKDDGKRTSMYAPEYRCWTDLISWEGLDMYTYISILDEEYPRRKEKPGLDEDDEE